MWGLLRLYLNLQNDSTSAILDLRALMLTSPVCPSSTDGQSDPVHEKSAPFVATL